MKSEEQNTSFTEQRKSDYNSRLKSLLENVKKLAREYDKHYNQNVWGLRVDWKQAVSETAAIDKYTKSYLDRLSDNVPVLFEAVKCDLDASIRKCTSIGATALSNKLSSLLSSNSELLSTWQKEITADERENHKRKREDAEQTEVNSKEPKLEENAVLVKLQSSVENLTKMVQEQREEIKELKDKNNQLVLAGSGTNAYEDFFKEFGVMSPAQLAKLKKQFETFKSNRNTMFGASSQTKLGSNGEAKEINDLAENLLMLSALYKKKEFGGVCKKAKDLISKADENKQEVSGNVLRFFYYVNLLAQSLDYYESLGSKEAGFFSLGLKLVDSENEEQIFSLLKDLELCVNDILKSGVIRNETHKKSIEEHSKKIQKFGITFAENRNSNEEQLWGMIK